MAKEYKKYSFIYRESNNSFHVYRDKDFTGLMIPEKIIRPMIENGFFIAIPGSSPSGFRLKNRPIGKKLVTYTKIV